MARRYVYEPRMSGPELVAAMARLNLGHRQLARLSGASEDRVREWMDGRHPVPVYVQRDFYVWETVPGALRATWAWVDAHAVDKRSMPV